MILACPTAAAAFTPPASSQTIEASAADLFIIADRLAKRGDSEQAERLLVLLSHDPDRGVRNEARYRHSLLLESRGGITGAAVLLRAILDEKPDASAVRLKLAALLHKLGDEESALRELRALRSADLPLSVARFVDRLSASLQASKPAGLQVEFALAPDSNINRATRSDTLGTIFGDFTLGADAKPHSGIGAEVRGTAHRRLALARDLSVVARASTDLNLYRDRRFNDISAELSAGAEFRLLNTRFTADVGFGRRWYGMKPYDRQLRISASASRPLDSVSQLRVDGSLRRSNNIVNDFQDGHGLTFRASYERALSPELVIAATVATDRFVARDAAYSTRSWVAGVSASRDVGRFTVAVGGEIGRLKSDDRLAILPEARADRLTRFTVAVIFRKFAVGGFAPMTRLVLERNRSNVEFYDFKRTRSEFGVSRAF